MKINAQNREITGKKVKNLRKDGLVPASIYGPKRPSTNITLDKKEFLKLFKAVGYNEFFDLTIGDDAKASQKSVKALVKMIQKHPVTDMLINVDFYQIDEESKITVEVPVTFTGESPAVKQNLGFLIVQSDAVALHCFPKDLPKELVVDISTLENPGDAITVGQIKLPESVELDSSLDATTAVVYIGTAQKEEEEVKPAEGTEGAVAADGTTPVAGAAAPAAADAKPEAKK